MKSFAILASLVALAVAAPAPAANNAVSERQVPPPLIFYTFRLTAAHGGALRSEYCVSGEAFCPAGLTEAQCQSKTSHPVYVCGRNPVRA